jgi:hypothetical protein
MKQLSELPRDEWLRRYRAELNGRCPTLTEEELAEYANIEAHEALSGEYPDNPERAVDDEIEDWTNEDASDHRNVR